MEEVVRSSYFLVGRSWHMCCLGPIGPIGLIGTIVPSRLCRMKSEIGLLLGSISALRFQDFMASPVQDALTSHELKYEVARRVK